MDTQTFWITVTLITTALLIITPLVHRALGARARQWAVIATGALAALSFALNAGVAAVVMTLPWLCLGAALAVGEVRRVGVKTVLRRPNAAVLGPLATWCWMTGGAAWLTAHRLGLEPLGFDRAITLLTVAHFHVAGLGLSGLLLFTHRRWPGRPLLVAIWLHQVGMLTVAAGLMFSDHFEVAGAAAIASAIFIWAASVVRLRRELRGLARVLLTVAVVAWVVPMLLVLCWVLAPFLPEPVVWGYSIMVRYHAVLNTFGLTLCGLLGVLLSGAEPGKSPLTATTDDHRMEDHDDPAHQTHP